MINVRRATVDDAAELVRLRGILFGLPDGSNDGNWREASQRILLRRLAEPSPTMAGFVVDQPLEPVSDRPAIMNPSSAETARWVRAVASSGNRLAAGAVGIVEERLGGPGNPHGLVGYMFNVATDPAHRRHGYARACTAALLEWFTTEGANTVDLRATATAEPLYASQGFVRTADPAMRLVRPPQ
ncbi:GNAT family N-acetyltransferase [Paractinoplanes brasiliensis]|uniref:Acetyltransferase (GNAT) family protein n=1 Tax=Paractinoplanes brasiliensis TaxID=52695 RepID=A0A4R6J8I6_9ACTN|nr:GNAT family N-acetyltransferase [Actinoplanes brasiliensis]TDO31904.1 acetyltransferase (GNAT) family protein [Actinoplanes brasiliensis]GID27946.1 N-acetyltransferase [Actinoplanes brasiliensis]